jgi:hypothetical protein
VVIALVEITFIEYKKSTDTLTVHLFGHPTEAVERARNVAMLIMDSGGPWRFSDICGRFLDETDLDDRMFFKCLAERKRG